MPNTVTQWFTVRVSYHELTGRRYRHVAVQAANAPNAITAARAQVAGLKDVVSVDCCIVFGISRDGLAAQPTIGSHSARQSG
jgi:hypothetical protein